MKIVDYENGALVVRLGGATFHSDLELVKNLAGSIFNQHNKTWNLAPIRKNLDILMHNGWIPTESVKNKFLKQEKPITVEIDENRLNGLFDFQKEGVRWLEQNDGRGLIGDEMGLGKTIQVIGYAMLHPEKRPLLVVCPASMKMKWQMEIAKWTGEKSIILYGKKASLIPKASDYKWIIVNYDVLAYQIDAMANLDLAGIIIDESQMVSNRKAMRTMAIKEIISKKIKDKPLIGLSGTPIRNRPSEFFTMLNLLAPSVFPNRWRFLMRYCEPKNNGFGWEFNGATNVEELHDLISPYMIRRLKTDVAKDLPPKIKSIVPLELERINKRNYLDAEGEFRKWLEDHSGQLIEEQKQLEKLKQLAYLAKRNSVLEWIQDFLESGEKLVVMAYHTMAIDDICSKFGDIAVRYDGSTGQEDRQKAIDEFQNNPDKKLFVGQIIAAGVGITLTAASNLAFVEFTFTPADHAQAEDRIHRIGQNAKMVNIYYLVGDGTIDNKIVNMIVDKYDVVKNVLDGSSEGFLDRNQTDFLVKKLVKEYTKAEL